MTREEKQKAIDVLKISAPVITVTQEEFKDYIQTLNKIMDCLEQETVSKESYDHEYFLRKELEIKMAKIEQQEPKWIPVSERLPQQFRFVNCTCHSLIDDREDWVVETVYIPQPPNSPYSDWGNIPMLNWKQAEVIAWMYRDIPKPYKAESEEKI